MVSWFLVEVALVVLSLILCSDGDLLRQTRICVLVLVYCGRPHWQCMTTYISYVTVCFEDDAALYDGHAA